MEELFNKEYAEAIKREIEATENFDHQNEVVLSSKDNIFLLCLNYNNISYYIKFAYAKGTGIWWESCNISRADEIYKALKKNHMYGAANANPNWFEIISAMSTDIWHNSLGDSYIRSNNNY